VTPNHLTGQIIDAAYRVHRTLGPGLLESIYESALAHELTKREIPHHRQHPIPAIYDGIILQPAFYADLLVADEVIVELKSVESISPVHKKQLLTYLRLSGKTLGLLINFNVLLIKDGITRIINS
jgi:GxxExxY protein